MRRGLSWAGVGVLLVLSAGCRATLSGPEAGADSSQEAVVQFLAGAKSEDLQAMSAVWGDTKEPTREHVSRRELEMRLMIMTCHLKHDTSVVGVAQRGEEGRTVHRVELTTGARTVTVPFTAVQNTRSKRWFVYDVDLRPAREFCRSGSATP